MRFKRWLRNAYKAGNERLIVNMEIQTNRQEMWIRGKFDRFISNSNREKLTDYVVARLVQVRAGEIFWAGLPEKVVRGVANVLVETAYSETLKAPAKDGSLDKLLVKRRFYTGDPEIIEMCQNAGMFYGKRIAKLMSDVLEKFDFDSERAKEVLKYVGMRRGDSGIYDIYSILRITTDASEQIKVISSPLGRKQIMDVVLLKTEKDEAEARDTEKRWETERIELMEVDPEYIRQNSEF